MTENLKNLTLEDCIRMGYSEKNWNDIQNSKSGDIWIQKISPTIDNPWRGHTKYFGEGLGCYLYSFDSWYSTSIIQSINWNKGTFDTINSTYKFKFTEDVSSDE